ncbi:hypothetical protein [Massilia antarctica]|uniref:hypothetical protein n=1 Tax=Massilia antarctica TaxID=2765360 RepID=UPI0015E19693|nr:hypothetical protein [Massilia sp. H27-R4]MCY0911682.1 hypothetical protein [Massilia sp. H27-R4]
MLDTLLRTKSALPWPSHECVRLIAPHSHGMETVDAIHPHRYAPVQANLKHEAVAAFRALAGEMKCQFGGKLWCWWHDAIASFS